MNYFEVITADKTWVCPKSGIYKIITVGGGSACGINAMYNSNYTQTINNSGGITTFGDRVTAKGGVSQNIAVKWDNYELILGGAGGYTLEQYGGMGGIYVPSKYVAVAPTLNGGMAGHTGIGYGAGGGSTSLAISTAVTSDNKTLIIGSTKSSAGDINEVVCDINSGDNIICIIGKGGTWTEEILKEKFTEFIVSNGGMVDSHRITTPIEQVISATTSGKDGCIVVEYLGESL